MLPPQEQNNLVKVSKKIWLSTEANEILENPFVSGRWSGEGVVVGAELGGGRDSEEEDG